MVFDGEPSFPMEQIGARLKNKAKPKNENYPASPIVFFLLFVTCRNCGKIVLSVISATV